MLSRKCTFILFVTLIFATLVLSGCGKTYSVKPTSPYKLFEKRTETALNSSNPSEQTEQKLRLMFLDGECRKDPDMVIRDLHEESRRTKDAELMTVTAELALLRARELERKDPHSAVVMNLMAASLAYDYLFGGERLEPADAIMPSYRFMADVYNMAVSKLVENRAKKNNPWVDQAGLEILDTAYDLHINGKGRGLWNPNLLDSLSAANDIQVKGLKNEYFAKGLGAPMVGYVDNPQTRAEFGKYFPVKGAAFPVTAVLSFEPHRRVEEKWRQNAELAFYDPVVTEYTMVNGMKIPLEADYTTPLGVLLSKIQAPDEGFAAMLKSDEYMSGVGMRMLEPYQPDKVPVIFVHGLMSTPETWVDMFNDLKGDPEIRRNYQFWFFIYPTGLPIIYSASLLRQDLLEMRAQFDPTQSNRKFDQAVIIGHSMGGLLTRLVVQDSETYYWDNVFTKPIGEVSLSEADEEFLEDVFFFEKVPFIKRALFLATPHRGSKLADKWFAKLGAGIVSLPVNIDNLGDDIMREPASELAFDPKDFHKRVPNSIDLLSPSSPFLTTMQKVPMDMTIPYHSIVGVRKATTGPGSSDGVVPYESSHLDFAISEKLVPSGHWVQKHALSIAEVNRILKLHLRAANKEETMVFNLLNAPLLMP